MPLRQRVLVPVAAAFAALGLPACAGTGDGGSGGDARKGGSITVAASGAPDSLDPAVGNSPRARQALWLVYTAPLALRRAEGAGGTELTPGLAEGMPEISEDGLSYTFKIRDGLRYSNRKAVRARDFEHTVKRVLRLGPGRSLFTMIDGAAEYMKDKDEAADIVGIEVDDKEREVTIRLLERDPTFLNKLASTFAGVVPTGTPFRDLATDPPPGVGPYAIRKVTSRQFVMVQTRGFDVGDLPEGNVQRITTRAVPDVERQTDGVVKGTFDYMQGSPPVEQLPEIRSKYKERYKERSTLSTFWFFLNERTPPFDNEKVRRAVNVALDKQALVRHFAGRLEATCNFLPRGVPGFNRIDPCPWGDPGLNGDPQRARQLIESSGEEGKQVTVFSERNREHRRVARYYTGLLDKIGLKAKLRVVRRLRGVRRGRAQTGISSTAAGLPHPLLYMDRLDGDVVDPGVEEKLAELMLEPDPENAAGGYAELDRMLVEEAYVAPFGAAKQSTFLSERMDRDNCSRVHPVYGADYSSFCLK
jgi:peptide/nickel transport system substrate-binding protein